MLTIDDHREIGAAIRRLQRQLVVSSVVAMVVAIVAPVEGGEDIVTKEAERAEAALAGRDVSGKGDFIIAPIPLVNPTLGYGLIGAAAVPAIVASITGRRPTRSDSCPQIGLNTNWSAG